MTVKKNTTLQAHRLWQEYQIALDRGHLDYQMQAQQSENFYFGAGRQWDTEGRRLLEEQGKPAQEENLIFGVVNTVLGYQTQSRMDITYKPREAGESNQADVLSQVAMYVLDTNQYSWLESAMFADGLIQARGYIEVKIDTSSNVNGDIVLTLLDPLDVIPDPDSKSYNPKDWARFMILDWMSFDDIRLLYGEKIYRELYSKAQVYDPEGDFGDQDASGVPRNKFGPLFNRNAYVLTEDGEPLHARILRKQHYVLTKRKFMVDLESGDLTPLSDDLSRAELKKIRASGNFDVIEKVVKRIKWTVACRDMILHEEWSPYDTYTIIPYFPFFRRGTTISLVDNLISTQEMVNKVFSQILHVVNTTANSGWMVQEDSLANMDIEELEERGAESGLVLEYKAGRERPDKIRPNEIPSGLRDILATAMALISNISGVSETFQGGKGPEVSGFAIQSRVHQTAIQLATCIDNLFRSRNLLAGKILELIQQFWTAKRTLLVTEVNAQTGETTQAPLTINDVDAGGEVINNVSIGKYDVVIADVPTQITFQNAQFQQGIEMRKYGIAIPDDEMVMMSTLARKNDIVKKLTATSANDQQMQAAQQQLQVLADELRKLKEKLNDKSVTNLLTLAKTAETLSTTKGTNDIFNTLLRQQQQKETQSPINDQQTLDSNQASEQLSQLVSAKEGLQNLDMPQQGLQNLDEEPQVGLQNLNEEPQGGLQNLNEEPQVGLQNLNEEPQVGLQNLNEAPEFQQS